jgi:CubicO group peptidase (beta-lactamase class C family)
VSVDRAAWRAAFIARLVARGVEYDDALATYLADEHDFDDDGADAADATVERWESEAGE